MPETFSPIIWHNDTFPAINETNLNRIETGVDALDVRAAALELGVTTPVTITYATSITVNATQGALFRCVASGDLTLDDIVGGIDGQTVVLEVQASGADRALHFTGSTDVVSIPTGQWWVGLFRFIATSSTWLLDDGSGGGGSSSGSGNNLNILAPQAVTYASTVTLNAATGALFRITATGDLTLASPINGTDGQAVVVEVEASGGTRILSFAGGAVSTVSLPAGSRWTGTMRYDASDDVWVLSAGGGGGGGSSSSGGYATVQDEGSSVTTRTTLNFIGAGVTVADDATNSRTNVTISGGGSGGSITVQDEGSSLTARSTLNFIGAGVTAADNAGSARTDVTISGGYATVAEEGSALTSRATLNFVGRAVLATDNSGSSRTDVTVLDTPPVHTVGNSGTALTVDAGVTAGPVKTITMTGNCTFTFSAVTSGRLITMDLILTQDGTGSRTATWPASVKWSGGAPLLSTTAGARDWFTFSTPDGGTTWYGAVVGKGFA